MITQPKRENAKIERRDTGVSAYKSNEPVMPNLYLDAGARLHHDFGRFMTKRPSTNRFRRTDGK
jgi:hypothetical protein